MSFGGARDFSSQAGTSGTNEPWAPVADRGNWVFLVIVTKRTRSRQLFRWWSVGALTEAGRWSDCDYCWAAVNAVADGILQNELRLIGAHGTITIRFEGAVSPALAQRRLTVHGQWQVVGGTGEYQSLRGGGTVVADLGDATLACFTGRLSGAS